jgi:hypothetical protein
VAPQLGCDRRDDLDQRFHDGGNSAAFHQPPELGHDRMRPALPQRFASRREAQEDLHVREEVTHAMVVVR